MSTTEEAGKELSKIFDKENGEKVFDYPKDVSLISYLLKFVDKKDAIVLDSFAGSGTTAHSVLKLNEEDNGCRKFILVELMDYADTITAERVKRVIKGYGKRNIRVGINGIPKYNDEIKNVPHVCLKIPTGGGKTFVACHAIKTIFDNYEKHGKKFVVWLVPSESILEQTLKKLKDVNHPYRQVINSSFNNSVEIYTKEELLNGQNFNISSIEEQLGIAVLTFDSFRITNKEGRRIYQENSNFQQFVNYYDNKETLVSNVNETALIQVINQLKPLVIVDKNHNAVSDLSIEMLKNINPSFVIDLTATPTYLRLNKNEITKFKKYLQEIPDETKKNACINVLCRELEKLNYISKNEIRGYIERIVGRMTPDELVNLENNVFAMSYKIKIFIEELVKKYRKDRFYTLSEKGIIKEKMYYSFPNEVSILDYTENITNSLYQAEKNDMNTTEFKILNIINSCDNILWWHRIKERDENDFYINGFINHYPDFMFMTKKGKIIVVEVKGEQLKNEETIDKLNLGRKWQQLAGENYRYYMVFINSAFENIEGTYDINKLCDIIKEL